MDPEGRIRKIVNGGGEFAKLKLSNIELFGERKLVDYQSDAEMQRNREIEAERVKNARIYGKDPGGLDVKEIEKMSERELFEIYYAITYEVWAISHHGRRDFSNGYMTEEEWKATENQLSELQYSVEYLLYIISKRINIPVNEPEVDKHIRPDKDLFMKWYNFHEKDLSGDWRTSA
ncbi:hypothetical protein IJH02_02300 [Candidatus Saccharibacteria bacterium]|nr:hypothetical protein [Candidatus Saccharibacteria bacterium]